MFEVEACTSGSEGLSYIRYMTLSHCWGSAEFIRLLMSNMEEFRRGRPISSLPQNFRDAIAVTRRFSIRYLWIDSLCIIQDSVTDWKSESSMMRDVYANSVCNIAAAASQNPYQGLFRTRRLDEILRIVEAHWADRPKLSLLVNMDEGEYWLAQLDSAPLLRRGWVIQ